jgi:hypothetical protein
LQRQFLMIMSAQQQHKRRFRWTHLYHLF